MRNNADDNYLKKELYQLIKTDDSIFDFIQESSLDGLWYWDLENPENEWMNPKFWTVLGYNPSEMPHKSSAWQQIINQDDLKTASDNFTKHCENPKHPYDQIVRYTHKSGAIIWIRCRGMAIRDNIGKPIRMLGAHHNITESMTSLALNRTMAEMLDIAPSSITVHDMYGNFLYANQKTFEIHGYSSTEYLSLNLHEIDVPTSECLIAERIELIKKNGHATFEVEHYRKDGSIFPLEVYVKKVMWQEKPALLSIASDISKRKIAEQELIKAKEKAEESDRLKTAFLQNVSHEIRTPMNAIMGFSELLVLNYNNKPKLENFSQIINHRCNDLLVIIEDILDTAKIESGQLPVTIENCNLNSLFRELQLFFAEQQIKLKKQHIELSLKAHCDPAGSIILTDKVKLKQIFINLIGNAFKFTEAGMIEGGCKLDSDNNLIFFVSDTGIGIPSEKQKLIFERFAQIEQTPNRQYGGTGLGLSIVKGLVELLGGRVWLESKLARGTTFYFTLPYKSEHNQKHEPIDIEETNIESPLNRKTILIVEDDIYNLAYIKEILYDTGITIISSQYGNEAIQIVATQPIDIVLMDIGLPDITGYEATRQIKQQQPKLKIIAQTAYASPHDKLKSLDAGCDDYISKPLKSKMLLSLINKHLS